jgi:hypothetical protein
VQGLQGLLELLHGRAAQLTRAAHANGLRREIDFPARCRWKCCQRGIEL